MSLLNHELSNLLDSRDTELRIPDLCLYVAMKYD